MKHLKDHFFLVAYFVTCFVVLIAGQSFQNGAIAQDDPCNLPAEPGFCYAYFPSFYYDFKSDRCMPFVYGGCGGNANRFESERECGKFRHRCLRTRGKINSNQYNRINRNIQF